MKRIKRIKASSYYGDVEITVRVNSTWGLTRSEIDTAATELADSSMKAINVVRHLSVPLSKIKVS